MGSNRRKRKPEFSNRALEVQDAILQFNSGPAGIHPSAEQRKIQLVMMRRIARAWGGVCLFDLAIQSIAKLIQLAEPAEL